MANDRQERRTTRIRDTATPFDSIFSLVTGTVESRLALVASRQHGVATRRQMREAGLAERTLDRRIASGRFRRLHRGVYQVGPLLQPLGEVMAAVLACGPTAVGSHGTAARLWRLVGTRDPREPIDVIVVGSSRGRGRSGIRPHRVASLDRKDRATVDGIPVTAPARTILDLASVLGPRELERAVARAEQQRLVTLDDLRELTAGGSGRRGIGALRAVLAASGGPATTASEAEERFLALIRRAGLPAPRTDVPEGPYRIDFLWPRARIAVEVDGFRHHGTRPRFEADRRKDAWLSARGFTVIRLSWRQIVEAPLATAVQVGQALARADGRA